jgi:hypothetical protein
VNEGKRIARNRCASWLSAYFYVKAENGLGSINGSDTYSIKEASHNGRVLRQYLR